MTELEELIEKHDGLRWVPIHDLFRLILADNPDTNLRWTIPRDPTREDSE